jgi:hypothetical protein
VSYHCDPVSHAGECTVSYHRDAVSHAGVCTVTYHRDAVSHAGVYISCDYELLRENPHVRSRLGLLQDTATVGSWRRSVRDWSELANVTKAGMSLWLKNVGYRRPHLQQAYQDQWF